MGVKTAFLNGNINENIYMEQPEGFRIESLPDNLCKLQEAFHGLKQTPKQWYAKINFYLCEDLNFERCSYDPCLYVKRANSESMLITIYVEDLLIAASSKPSVLQLKTKFWKWMEMKDCQNSRLCSESKPTRDSQADVLQISQTHQVEKTPSKVWMETGKPVLTPKEC